MTTATIIDFAQELNARCVRERVREREAAREARRAQDRADLVDQLGGSLAAQIVAEVVSDAKERHAADARASRFIPAYCDPANEVRGAKHDATANLDIRDIAKRMRADIKALALPAGIKTSVRLQRYSGGQAIDIRITALPSGFPLLSDAAASWKKQFPHRANDVPGAVVDHRSAEFHRLMQQLERIHGAYNRDNSDSMTDYFDCRYYGSVSLDWTVRRECEEQQVAAHPGTYWAEDAARF